MTHAIDTDFLVAVEIREHIYHQAAEGLLHQLLSEEHDIALTPQTLAEFIHVVTDPRRMKVPLSMTEATQRAEVWWQAREVVRLFPDERSVTDWLLWISRYRLGRKRLLDTMLASTCSAQGIRRLITNNGADYKILGVLEIIPYGIE